MSRLTLPRPPKGTINKKFQNQSATILAKQQKLSSASPAKPFAFSIVEIILHFENCISKYNVSITLL